MLDLRSTKINEPQCSVQCNGSRSLPEPPGSSLPLSPPPPCCTSPQISLQQTQTYTNISISPNLTNPSMSWLKTVVNRAAEVGANQRLARTVLHYADTVVQQAGHAVSSGSRVLQTTANRNLDGNGFKLAAKRLEEEAVSCRGRDRVELLKRWLVCLKEIERICGASSPPPQYCHDVSDPENSDLVLFFDSELDGESLNFREVFLQSQALEGMTMSMILEGPNDEEVSLLVDIFGFCLTGDKEVHKAIIRHIQELAAALSSYEDEVLVKREELLQFAQCAISGLKHNADLARIDAESSTQWKKIYGMKGLKTSADKSSQKTSLETCSATIEAFEETLEEVQLCSRLEELLLKKKTIKTGNTLVLHNEKIDRLKVLAESLANSSSKAETRISDQRHQLEEALNFRVAKASEVTETEKGLIAEISRLDKQKDELEAELKKVNISLKDALVRLQKHREERNHFDEASDQIIIHFKLKEDELSRSAASCKIEAHIIRVWISFLEDTWRFQTSYSDQKEKQTSNELEKYGILFVNLIKHHLLACKNELGVSVNLIKALVDNLKKFNTREDESATVFSKDLLESNPQEILEEEYLQVERKIVTALNVADRMKDLFYAEQVGVSRRDDPQIEELFNSIEKSRKEFETVERPNFEIANSKEKDTSSEKNSHRSPIFPALTIRTSRVKNTESPRSGASSTDQHMYSAAGFAKLDSEYGSTSGGYSSEDLSGWEL